jgi:hypothetical protein
MGDLVGGKWHRRRVGGKEQAGVTRRKPGEPTAPTDGPRPPPPQEARRAREAEALRANLKRRKQQARARKAETVFAPDPALR